MMSKDAYKKLRLRLKKLKGMEEREWLEKVKLRDDDNVISLRIKIIGGSNKGSLV